MKKMVAIILAIAVSVSMLVLPVSAEETDLLEQQFREALDYVDARYDYFGSYLPDMIVKANQVICEQYGGKGSEFSQVVSAEEYEAALSKFFAPTAEDMSFIRKNGPYFDEPGVINARPLEYNAEDNTYTVFYPVIDPLYDWERAFMGYVVTSQGFDVYYGNAQIHYLYEALPDGVSEHQYAGQLNNPETLEYDGKLYHKRNNLLDTYYYTESMEKVGMKYSVELTTDSVRILSVQPFTEGECPDSFEKLPEVDEDLLSIMADIKDLVEKYGPEIPDEVKNGTQKGTSSSYKPSKSAYYVSIGDDTAQESGGYVKLLAEKLGISYKNLADKGMLIDEVNAAFLEANAAEIQKADLISIGFSLNSFAAVAVDEVLKNKSEEESYMQWGRYIHQEEGVREIEAVLARMEEYLQGTGMTGNIPILNIPKTDALVVAAESLAFGTLAYTYELPRLIDDIRAINSTAQIVIVGMDNPMENSTVKLSSGEKMEVGIYVDQLINNMDDASQAVAIEKGNVAFVSAPDASNEYDNSELTENKLIVSYLGSVKPQVKPNDAGHAYIRDQILMSMRKKGDVNCDGKADYSDALLILRASIGLETLAPENLVFADVTGDGKADYSDALKILRASIGLEDLENATPEHQHSWQDATCTEPRKCKTCGVTEGTAKGHDWLEATETEPKTCKLCGATEGTVKEHDWVDATCTEPKKCKTCGATEGTAKGHDWVEATCTEAKHCKTCGEKDGKALGHALGDDGLCTRCGATSATTINLPEAPKTITFYGAGDTKIRSWELNTITAEQISVDSDGDMTYKITVTGTCTYNVAGDAASEGMWIGYKIYDAEGVVIKSSTTQSAKVAVGEKFKKEITLYDLKPGEIYEFALVDVR